MQIVRAPNDLVTISPKVVGNRFALRLPPGKGLQVLPLGPSDVRLAQFDFEPHVVPPSVDPRRYWNDLRGPGAAGPLPMASTRIELAAGQLFPYPPDLRDRELLLHAYDPLLPNGLQTAATWLRTLGPYPNPTLTVGVLEHELMADAALDLPGGVGYGAHCPMLVGFVKDEGVGGAPVFADLTNGELTTYPIYVGDAQGKLELLIHVDKGTDAAPPLADPPTGTLYVESSKDGSVNGHWFPRTWATKAVIGTELFYVVSAEHLGGPYLRVHWVWSAGVTAGRMCQIYVHKSHGR